MSLAGTLKDVDMEASSGISISPDKSPVMLSSAGFEVTPFPCFPALALFEALGFFEAFPTGSD
jgi:hypothetical protein